MNQMKLSAATIPEALKTGTNQRLCTPMYLIGPMRMMTSRAAKPSENMNLDQLQSPALLFPSNAGDDDERLNDDEKYPQHVGKSP